MRIAWRLNPPVTAMQIISKLGADKKWKHSMCEVACDEAVVASYGIERRGEYVDAILGFVGASKSRVPILSTYFFGGSSNIKKRLNAIMDTNRKSKKLAMLCALAIVAATTIFGNVIAASVKCCHCNPRNEVATFRYF
jgi:beta-lactamase regulating signal transducer with metallopeptidase domain